MFKEGDEVEVWSRSKERWMRGHVTNLVKDAGADGQGLYPETTAGSVKVKLAHQDKWVDPSQFELVRHCVPFETPVDPEVPPFGCFRTLRTRYFTTEGGSSSHGTGGEHQLRIGMAALERVWLAAAEEDVQRGSSQQQDRDLIHQRVKKSFQAANVHYFLGQDDATGSVDLCEWLHHTLMLLHAPGPDTVKTIANELKSSGPKTLSQLVSRWMRMDKAGSGLISKYDLAEAFREEFWPRLSLRLAEKMAAGMLRDMDASGLGQASYSEFVLRCLGRECSEVVLYYYDLSNDWAKYLSPLLLGSWEGGLWHTGISCFGREYFYGGRVCYGPPGATVWGRPTRAMRLGLTTRSLDSLREHIFVVLDRKYDRKSYDVLDRNCNHFADEAARFLLGRGIPDEVRLQPQRLMGAPVARMLRPLLNRWLGRVEQGGPLEEGKAIDEAGERRHVSVGGA